MSHRFIICDVFTDRAFGGNQLGVFPEAAGISDVEMQAYARELNFSETTFVLPPRTPGHTHRVRIFTPTKEIPFAGHPNVGTAVVLASLARAAGGAESAEFIFDEDVGTVGVAATAGVQGGSAELTIRQQVDIRAVDVPRNLLAAMLSLSEDRLGSLEPWAGSLGIPFFCLPLAEPDAVAAALFDVGAWQRALPEDSWARDVYAVAGDFRSGGHLKVRMWAPADGVPEDPATGSAAALLAGSLAARLPDRDGHFAWTVAQGAELGRPSFIAASVEKRDGRVVAIRVGGGVAIVAEGSFHPNAAGA
jgi:trans-2,3-dihydro-3-hydroxyanthranilate isomerase